MRWKERGRGGRGGESDKKTKQDPHNVAHTLLPLPLPPFFFSLSLSLSNGLIDAAKSVAGMLAVLEAGAAGEVDLHGHWYDWKKEEIKW